MFQTFVGPVENDAAVGVPPPRDRAGHLRQLRERADHDAQEAAVRHRADRQVVPQRDHAPQLHLPRRASSSRWRWSTSSRRKTARSGTSTGVRSGIVVHRSRHRRRSLRLRAHATEELSHYSAGTSDFEYLFPWGWGELEGIAHRGDFDLTAAQQRRAARISPTSTRRTNELLVPHVIEPAAGRRPRACSRSCSTAYDEETSTRRARSAPCCTSTRPSRRSRSAVLPLSRRTRS